MHSSPLRPHLFPSRSEHFPYREQTMMYGDVPVLYFDVGTGPAIVLVHGLGANLTHFEHVAPPLVAAGYRVCGLDMPGFGLSGKPHRRYSIRWLSEAVVALLDHLGIASATLSGHSLGGLVCADAALHARARVERLVLISSAGLFQMPLAIRWVARTLLKPSMVATALQMSARVLLEQRVFEEHNDLTKRFIEQSLSRPDPRFCKDLARVMYSLRRELTEYHLFDEVHRLTMPTLVIYGESDKLLPFKSVPTWASRLPAGKLEVIERCGHMPIIEKPERVVAAIQSFMLTEASSLEAAGANAMSRAS
jgi:pimeloyl-ACP methyl ester carboxylesterase